MWPENMDECGQYIFVLTWKSTGRRHWRGGYKIQWLLGWKYISRIQDDVRVGHKSLVICYIPYICKYNLVYFLSKNDHSKEKAFLYWTSHRLGHNNNYINRLTLWVVIKSQTKPWGICKINRKICKSSKILRLHVRTKNSIKWKDL